MEQEMTHQMIIAPHRPYDTDKLAAVTAEMRRRGAPSIRVYDAGDHYIALEGAHRLAAADALGLPVNITVLEDGDEIDHDFGDVEARTASAIIAYLTDSSTWPMDSVAYTPAEIVED